MTTLVITRRTRARVSSPLASLALLATDSLARSATGAASRAALDDRAPAINAPVRIRFENESRERVHVYLVSETTDWLLGPVEPGTHVWLALPRRALGGSGGPMRLVALAGTRVTLQASRDPRAVMSLGQPTGELLEHRWVFAQGQLWPMRLR